MAQEQTKFNTLEALGTGFSYSQEDPHEGETLKTESQVRKETTVSFEISSQHDQLLARIQISFLQIKKSHSETVEDSALKRKRTADLLLSTYSRSKKKNQNAHLNQNSQQLPKK